MLLRLHNLHKAFGANPVLRGVSLQLPRGERAGLVGINGSGKSTILKIVIGDETADEGELYLSRDVKVGYLSQKPEFSSNATLRAFLEAGVADLLSLKEEMAALEQQIAQVSRREGDNAPRLVPMVERYGTLAHRFEERGGYNLEHRLRTVARGLGFTGLDIERSLATFSGGEKTRAQLASLLLQEPELLLLDEPTNNLDMEAVEWLENYLSAWRGALLVVSHDRYFLDRVATAVLLLEKGLVRTYRGNYSAYQSQRRLEEATALKTYRKQQAVIEKERSFILNAAADARTKRQARSREKHLEKMAPLQGITREREMNIKLGFAGRSGKLVVALDNISKTYGSKQIFTDVNLEIHWGDRVAVVGPNGAGKTTLLRVITGQEAPTTGNLRVGPSVRIAYFDQEQEQLDPNGTPLAVVMDASPMHEPEARNYLARYLFQGEDVFKKIGTLSGGEISRLALAKMGLVEGNFLIMDEPTNHLDIQGVEELETTLAAYGGTILLVSHDRYFISRTAGKILEMQNGRVHLFQADYAEYREMKDKEKAVALAGPPLTGRALEAEKAARLERQQQEKLKRAEIMAQRRRRREAEQQLAALEEEIHQAEAQLALLEQRLADPAIYDRFAEARVVMDDLKTTRCLLEECYHRWEKTAALLEELPLP